MLKKDTGKPSHKIKECYDKQKIVQKKYRLLTLLLNPEPG